MRQFEKVQAVKPKRSAFDLSHERKTTLNMGELIPVMCHEILPGDIFKIDFESFLRTMPLVSPVMHRVNLYAHAFFVPNRLLLDTNRWEEFITEKNTNDILPFIAADAFRDAGAAYLPQPGDLFDHLGYGYKVDGASRAGDMSQMAIRAYHKIWNDYYRDQNFQNEYDIIGLPDSIDYGDADVIEFATVRKRAWEKDYFTASLPSQQRGNVVAMPLGGNAPVRGKSVRTGVPEPVVFEKTDLTAPAAGNTQLGAGSHNLQDSTGADIMPTQGLEADLSAATGASITELRRAFALQRWFEASMRFGQRYVEQLLGLFGVVSKDARLQRAEYIAGGKIPVQIGEVLQTSASLAGSSPQGTMAGRAVSAGSVMRINRRFDEHGWLMIIVSVLPRTSYATLALRQNFKLDTFDFAFPHLAHLSEQPVYIGELWNRLASNAANKAPFGYQPMYSEYRYIPDSVHGDFRTSLGFWSLARDFNAQPGLSEDFIKCTPRTDIFPVAFANQQCLLQTFAKILAIRPIPKFGTPY